MFTRIANARDYLYAGAKSPYKDLVERGFQYGEECCPVMRQFQDGSFLLWDSEEAIYVLAGDSGEALVRESRVPEQEIALLIMGMLPRHTEGVVKVLESMGFEHCVISDRN